MRKIAPGEHSLPHRASPRFVPFRSILAPLPQSRHRRRAYLSSQILRFLRSVVGSGKVLTQFSGCRRSLMIARVAPGDSREKCQRPRECFFFREGGATYNGCLWLPDLQLASPNKCSSSSNSSKRKRETNLNFIYFHFNYIQR